MLECLNSMLSKVIGLFKERGLNIISTKDKHRKKRDSLNGCIAELEETSAAVTPFNDSSVQQFNKRRPDILNKTPGASPRRLAPNAPILSCRHGLPRRLGRALAGGR